MLKQFFGSLLILCAVTGCSKIVGEQGIIRDRSNDFRESRNGKTLVLPPQLSPAKMSDYYVVPPTQVEYGATPHPPGSLLAQVAQADIPHQQPLPISAIKYANYRGQQALHIAQKPSTALLSLAAALHRRDIKVTKLDKTQHTLWFFDTFQTFDKLTSNTPSYCALVIAAEYGSYIVLRTKDDQPVNPATAKRLLAEFEKGLVGRDKSGLLRMITG